MLLLVSSRMAICTSGFFARGFSVAAPSGCMPAVRRARRMILVFMSLFFLFGDFINGVAERHPRRGLGMILEKIEISLGVELHPLPLGHILRVGINPLLAILEKGAAIHELRLPGVLGEAIRFLGRGRCIESESAQ